MEMRVSVDAEQDGAVKDERSLSIPAASFDPEKNSAGPPSPIALLDPLQELCPSLDAVQALCARKLNSLPGGNAFRHRCLTKAFLKAASSGDAELLGWISYMHSQRHRDDIKEAAAFRSMDLSESRDEEGTGPLVLAASSGHVEAVRLLVRHGMKVDERDALGWTPLMWAINNVNLPLVSFLLSQGADSHVKSYKGTTCEDFIISSDSSYGDAETLHDGLGDDTSSITRDRQLIGELIYEHQRSQPDAKAPDADGISTNINNLNLNGRRDSSVNGSPQNSTGKITNKHSRTASSSARRLIGITERTQLKESELRERELAEGRRRALLDVAVLLQVDYQDLVGEQPAEEQIARRDDKHCRRKKYKSSHSGLASGCGAIEVGSDTLSNEFDFDSVRADQMLVMGEVHIEAVIDFLVSNARPLRAPWTHRCRPANVIYLCVRFAANSQDATLQEELLFAYISAVEAILYAKPTELTHLAFWLGNTVLLLHYMNVDTTLSHLPSTGEHTTLLSELINEIFIFIVRDVERRIDKILQVAILDYESIAPFDDLRYEDEWSIFKTIRGSVKGLGSSNAASPSTPSTSLRRPLSQMFARDTGSSRNSIVQHDSPKRSSRAGNVTPLGSVFPSSPPSTISSPSKQRWETGSGTPSASDLLAKPSPRTISALLTSVLHVLQLYEINPCIIVQIFSQVFFWVGCEVFNRIVSHKRYMCKNKAMQIRLNISMLEDWIKTNALPSSLVQVHFDKANQLVGWILCQSSLRDFDALIATMQGFRSLTPAQLKYVVNDYRYEVGEGRMNADCVQYLDQLHVDWSRQRANEDSEEQAGLHGHSRSGTVTQENQQSVADDERSSPRSRDEEEPEPTGGQSPISNTSDRLLAEVQKDIDLLFAPGHTLNDFVPRLPQSEKRHGEDHSQRNTSMSKAFSDEIMLNSRDMLPFVLPSSASALIVSPGDAFGFGRGHFMGTGTPSLKSMRTPSLLPSPSRSPLPLDSSAAGIGFTNEHRSSSSSVKSSASLATSSPHKVRGAIDKSSAVQGSLLAAPSPRSVHRGLGISSLTPSPSGEAVDPGRDADATSQRSSMATATSVASSSISALFPQGKGLAAGSSWQPVPLLPDGTLEALGEVMRAVR